MLDRWVKKKVLITVRTYPVPSRSSIEVSCTAGIDQEGHWIRLFPVPYRRLAEDKRFTKYQYIEVDVTKAEDSRPESYKPNIESIGIVPNTKLNKWEDRKAILGPLMAQSMCYLQHERDVKGKPTLGFIKPKITAFRIEPTTPKWTEGEIARLRQLPMFGTLPKTELQKLPFDFSYEFHCDEANCRGHKMMCTDWELGASYWSWTQKYGSNWEQYFKKKYETEMILEKDTHFFVGTLSSHPTEWIIIGLFYPPTLSENTAQPSLL